MFFSKRALGLELSNERARFVLLSGKKDTLCLNAFSEASFPVDTLKFSLREEGILNRDVFVSTIRKLHHSLLPHVKQVSLSIPDSTGRVMLLDVETRFKSKAEGIDIIRWKLKKSFPFDINEAQLDYQVIREKETGEVSLLVSLIAKPVVRQIEDLLAEAGLEPNRIDFTTFNLYSLFSQRLDLAENSLLVAFHESAVGILIFHEGKLEFYRAKEVSGGIREANRIYREINNSFLVFKEKTPGRLPNEAFCVYSGDDAEVFCALIEEATGLDPVLLDAERVITRSKSSDINQKTLRHFAAALGAATRNL